MLLFPRIFFYVLHPKLTSMGTVRFLSEARIFASTNPKYNDRLFIELQVQYMKIPSSNLGRTCCVQKLFLTFRTIFVHNMFSPCSAKRRASDKDLPVPLRTVGCNCKSKWKFQFFRDSFTVSSYMPFRYYSLPFQIISSPFNLYF